MDGVVNEDKSECGYYVSVERRERINYKSITKCEVNIILSTIM